MCSQGENSILLPVKNKIKYTETEINKTEIIFQKPK